MMFGVPTSEVRKPDRFLREDDIISFGTSEKGTVLHAPGHSPGGICIFVKRTEEPSIVFSGDTLFAGSIGRTDLWGGDYQALISSIKTKILCFPDDTIVLPGHGPRTSVGEERRFNPFLR
jgi:glyoxylase-like metal-dependent hydrolase (beta-lactamase superfamily II)